MDFFAELFREYWDKGEPIRFWGQRSRLQCETMIIFPRYFQYLLMDFCQTLVIGASGTTINPLAIRFWGQRSRSRYHCGGIGHSMLPLSSIFKYTGWVSISPYLQSPSINQKLQLNSRQIGQ